MRRAAGPELGLVLHPGGLWAGQADHSTRGYRMCLRRVGRGGAETRCQQRTFQWRGQGIFHWGGGQGTFQCRGQGNLPLWRSGEPSTGEVRGTFHCGGQGNLPVGRSGKPPVGRSGLGLHTVLSGILQRACSWKCVTPRVWTAVWPAEKQRQPTLTENLVLPFSSRPDTLEQGGKSKRAPMPLFASSTSSHKPGLKQRRGRAFYKSLY